MRIHNWTKAPEPENHLLEHQLDALKEGIQKLIDRVGTKPSGEPTRLRTYAEKATESIQEHPFAAIAIALGLGYVTARIARRAS